MTENIEAKVVVDVEGADEAKQLASAVSSVQEALQSLVAPLKSVISLANKAEQGIAKTGVAASTAAKEAR